MGWSLRLGRIAGIELRMHVSFFLLLAWIAFGYYVSGGRWGGGSRCQLRPAGVRMCGAARVWTRPRGSAVRHQYS